jgi:hypothetical protein
LVVILECLHRLKAKIAAELALSIDAELAGDIDEPGRRGGLDHMGVARRPGQGFWIDETSLAHGVLLLSGIHDRPAACPGRSP